MYSFFKPILNRGGAGRSMTRRESIDAVNPLVTRHAELLLAYGAALRDLADRNLADALDSGMNRARTDLAKLKETVFSLGGTPPNSTDLDPADVRLGDAAAEILHALDHTERAYRDTLRDALAMPHHQIRTEAILRHVLKGSEGRLDTLHPMVTRMRRPAERRAAPVPTDEITGAPEDLASKERHATHLERGNIQTASD